MEKKNFNDFITDERGQLDLIGNALTFIFEVLNKIPQPFHLLIGLTLLFFASGFIDAMLFDGFDFNSFGVETHIPSIEETIKAIDPNYEFALCMDLVAGDSYEPECIDLQFPYYCGSEGYGCKCDENGCWGYVGFAKGIAMVVSMLLLIGWAFNKRLGT